MVVTPFGDLDLDDDVALERWNDAHRRRHRTYPPILGIPGAILQGTIDGDWMHRHASIHVTIATFTGKTLSSADTKALALPQRWLTQRELIDWHDLHNRLHQNIDQVLGIT